MGSFEIIEDFLTGHVDCCWPVGFRPVVAGGALIVQDDVGGMYGFVGWYGCNVACKKQDHEEEGEMRRCRTGGIANHGEYCEGFWNTPSDYQRAMSFAVIVKVVAYGAWEDM